jgi:hypothetical protein
VDISAAIAAVKAASAGGAASPTAAAVGSPSTGAIDISAAIAAVKGTASNMVFHPLFPRSSRFCFRAKHISFSRLRALLPHHIFIFLELVDGKESIGKSSGSKSNG